jgi:Kef-type K+ transport system membrane component KefB
MFNLTTLLLQICIILITSLGLGWVFRKIHQPPVVGEMIAGILLGPTLLGWIAPQFSAFLFPPQSLDYLNALSQVGLIVFMYLVGLELDLKLLRWNARKVVFISGTGIVLPFVLGFGLALFLYPVLSLGSGSTPMPVSTFALFIGVAMSIAAFPVMARILQDSHLVNTHLGTIAISCAAIDDVTGWSLLAFLLLLVNGSSASRPLWMTLIGAVLYFATLFVTSRIPPKRLGISEPVKISPEKVAMFLLLALASSLVTEWLGVYPLFGAFLAGAITPRQAGFNHLLRDKLNDFTVVLLLPLFFALTGLRTSIFLLRSGKLWLYFAEIILVAILGKFGGATLSARLSGIPWRESTALGFLMNTRGLMELILLNIGLEHGLISHTVFTMFVLMAILTTLMTTPLLNWFYFPALKTPPERIPLPESDN